MQRITSSHPLLSGSLWELWQAWDIRYDIYTLLVWGLRMFRQTEHVSGYPNETSWFWMVLSNENCCPYPITCPKELRTWQGAVEQGKCGYSSQSANNIFWYWLEDLLRPKNKLSSRWKYLFFLKWDVRQQWHSWWCTHSLAKPEPWLPRKLCATQT